MAKFSRFDSRNKKIHRHKRQSIDRDIRIRKAEEEDKPRNRNLTKTYLENFWDKEDHDYEH